MGKVGNWDDVVGRCSAQRAAPLFFLFKPFVSLRARSPLLRTPYHYLTSTYHGVDMLRLVSSVSRPTSTGLLGKVVASTHSPHCSSSLQDSSRSIMGSEHHFKPGRKSFSSTSSRGADITLTVDGKEVTVPQGTGLSVSLGGV